MTAAPQDLDQLLALLSPGWIWSADRSGLWRRGCAMWVKPAGFAGRTEVYGSGLKFTGHISEVLPYLQKMGAA